MYETNKKTTNITGRKEITDTSNTNRKKYTWVIYFSTMKKWKLTTLRNHFMLITVATIVGHLMSFWWNRYTESRPLRWIKTTPSWKTKLQHVAEALRMFISPEITIPENFSRSKMTEAYRNSWQNLYIYTNILILQKCFKEIIIYQNDKMLYSH